VKIIGVLNTAVGKMVTAALWVSPVGVGSLIAASILRACDLLGERLLFGVWRLVMKRGMPGVRGAAVPGNLLASLGLFNLASSASVTDARGTLVNIGSWRMHYTVWESRSTMPCCG
jgi:hypothetical protein